MEDNYNPYYSGAVYFVGTVMDDGNVAPFANPLSKEADENLLDLVNPLSKAADVSLSGHSRSIPYVWANRPAVIISRDDCNKDEVLAVFLTRRKSGDARGWYKKFSPRQAEVQFAGGPAFALCSHVARVEMEYLAEYMGKVTQEELARIINEVRESGEFNEILPLLYQPETRRQEPEDGRGEASPRR